ncbi:MAG: amino acid ABC transporter ATP-binding protein [Chitinophagales bacterium]
MIKVNNLSKQFGGFTVLKGVNAHIKKGECIAIIGPSGTGKSVFLRSLAMLETPDQGNIYINGTDITRKDVNLNHIRTKMGMVYQGFHLFSHLTVLDNITLAPRWVKKTDKREARNKALELLNMVGLVDKAQSYPHQLSGGQQQRIAIARCMAMEPETMLMDEPTSALDPTMTREVLAIIRKLVKTGLTMLIVTHEMGFARDIADRVFYMDEGLIYEEGTPEEIFDNPQKEKTRSFITKLKTFNYEIHSRGFDMVAMNAQIEIFCQKYSITAKQLYHIQLLLEELVTEVFRQCYAESDPDIEYTIEYANETNEINIVFIYRAKQYNPFESNVVDDNLGMLLINNVSRRQKYIFKNGRNIVFITL